MTNIKHEYGDIMELDCEIPNANCEIIKVDGDVTTVTAEGYAELIELLKFDYDGVVLKVDYDRQAMNNIKTDKWDIKKNIIKINAASKLDELHRINLVIHGTGSIDLKIPAEKFDATIHGSGNICADRLKFGGTNATIHGSGDISFGDAGGVHANIHGSGDISFGNAGGVHASIHGSGDIEFADAGGVHANIHGSGDIKFTNAGGVNASIHGSGDIGLKKCDGLKININGSGNFKADEVNNKIEASIHGSGDINIKTGEVETFDIYIDSNGAVKAKGVTARRAKIEVPNNGKAEIGRVIEETVEICGDDADVTIHQRG